MNHPLNDNYECENIINYNVAMVVDQGFLKHYLRGNKSLQTSIV